MWSPARARASPRPKPIPSATTPSPSWNPSPAAAARANRNTPTCSASGCATWPKPMRAWWALPRRNFDVAVAEQHAVTLAAGMACEGAKPVVAIYSTFLQRAYDQLIHDVAVQDLDVLFAIDRAGLVGEDGPTHAGSFDLSYLR